MNLSWLHDPTILKRFIPSTTGHQVGTSRQAPAPPLSDVERRTGEAGAFLKRLQVCLSRGTFWVWLEIDGFHWFRSDMVLFHLEPSIFPKAHLCLWFTVHLSKTRGIERTGAFLLWSCLVNQLVTIRRDLKETEMTSIGSFLRFGTQLRQAVQSVRVVGKQSVCQGVELLLSIRGRATSR